jgi:hypothetical protein
MNVESRDSANLKPAELDMCGQVFQGLGLQLSDESLDHQVEEFPLVALVWSVEGDLDGFLFGSLERIGGTPAILWGPGAARRGRQASAVVKALTGEYSRRAAISFPDEDVLVGTLFAQPAAYALLSAYSDVVPRPGYKANGEERAWGRRLAKRFGVEASYDDREFRVAARSQTVPVFDTSSVKATGGKKVVDLVGALDANAGQAMIAFGWAVAEALEAGDFLHDVA